MSKTTAGPSELLNRGTILRRCVGGESLHEEGAGNGCLTGLNPVARASDGSSILPPSAIYGRNANWIAARLESA